MLGNILEYLRNDVFRNVIFRWMLISDALLTDAIRKANDFKEYEMVFIVIPMNQPQPVVSTQGTNRTTPSALKTPNLMAASPQKKRKQVTRDSSSPRKSLKVQ
nr:hypothetical protein [Tanacetum cinerariifolium]